VTKPFHRLKNKRRAAFVLSLAGYFHREVALLLNVSKRTVERYIKAGKNEYPEVFDTIKEIKVAQKKEG
jgi:DNA-directed RNA polymerase specialized sigma24 family protein